MRASAWAQKSPGQLPDPEGRVSGRASTLRALVLWVQSPSGLGGDECS